MKIFREIYSLILAFLLAITILLGQLDRVYANGLISIVPIDNTEAESENEPNEAEEAASAADSEEIAAQQDVPISEEVILEEAGDRLMDNNLTEEAEELNLQVVEENAQPEVPVEEQQISEAMDEPSTEVPTTEVPTIEETTTEEPAIEEAEPEEGIEGGLQGLERKKLASFNSAAGLGEPEGPTEKLESSIIAILDDKGDLPEGDYFYGSTDAGDGLYEGVDIMELSEEGELVPIGDKIEFDKEYHIIIKLKKIL